MQTAIAEEQLLSEAQAYADEAWAAIFDENYPKMLDYCYLRTGNRAVAEDLASEVFLEALRSIKGFQYRGVPLAAWLYRIAHHVTVDHLRRSAKRPTQPLADGHLEANGLSIGSEAAALDDRHDLEQAMRTLTADQQQVLLLRFYHGLSHEETGAAMRRNPVAVRVLQSRALKALRRALTRGESRYGNE